MTPEGGVEREVGAPTGEGEARHRFGAAWRRRHGGRGENAFYRLTIGSLK